MPAPTPDEVRKIVVRMLTLGHNISTIEAVTELTDDTIRTIKRQWEETGSYRRPETNGIVGRPRILEAGDVWYMAERICQSPDLFLDELQRELELLTGREASISTIQRALQRFGFTYKLDKRAMERCEEDRDVFRDLIRGFRLAQLVFADESSINRKGTYRNRGYALSYALSGERAHKKTFWARGKRYSILPAITVNGILTALVVKGSYNAPLFMEFLDLCLANMNPFPQDNSVLVLDNCPIHCVAEVVEKCEERGVILAYLPSYSPDFNPIELAFSKIKGNIHREGEEARATLARNDEDSDKAIQVMLFRHIYSVTPKDAREYFAHCGYTED